MSTDIGGEIPCSDVGFPKGNSPEEFLANMLAFLETAAAKIANPPPWPDFSPDLPTRPSVVAITKQGGGKIAG